MPAPPTTNREFPNPQLRRPPIDGRTSIDPSDPNLLGSIHTNLAVVYLAGANISTRVRVGSVRIEQQQGQPDRCTFRMDGTAPLAGQEIKIGLGDTTTANLLFAGSTVSVSQVYEGRPANQAWDCECIDYTWLLNRRRPYGTFTGSATAIAQSLIATFARGFTAIHVQASLPTVTIVFDGSEDFQTCLNQLATLVSGYWYLDYAKDLHFFTAEATDLPDLLDGTGTKLQLDPPVTLDTDLRQLRTRTNVQGAGSRVLAPIAIGETIIPIENPSLYASVGGSVISNGQILNYTSKSQASPPDPPVAASAAGTGLGAGTYLYAYTDVTGAGESLPSPTVSVVTGSVTDPTTAPTVSTTATGTPLGTPPTGGESDASIGQTLGYKYSYSTATTAGDYSSETLPTSSASLTSISNNDPLNPTKSAPVGITLLNTTDTRVKWIYIYRMNSAVDGIYRICKFTPNNTAGGSQTVYDTVSDLSVGQQPAVSNSAIFRQVSVSAIAVGPSAVTSRKLYRTVVNGAALKLLATLADNVTTTYTDSTADGSLGAAAPTSDTSGLTLFGLTTTSGSTAAGATTINVTSATSFQSTGGWALIGTSGIAIRYTGTGATTLTGVPASGAGSVVTAIPSGTLIQGCPALTGVPASGTGGVVVALNLGDVVNIFVQRNDTTAQATMAGVDGGDGIYEFHLTDDTLITVPQCQARGDADLARFSTSIQMLRYATRDSKTRAGKVVTAALASPTSISGSFTIQRVTIDQIDLAAGRLAPRYTVEAGRVLLTVDAWLQQFQLKAA